MPPVFSTLVWKEWREQRGKLAALVAIALGSPLLMWVGTFSDDSGPGEPFLFVFLTLILYVPIASLFVGMGLAAGEQAGGTIDLLRGMPAPMRRVALAKLLVGVAVVVAPALALMLSASLVEAVAGYRGINLFKLSGGEAFPGPFDTGFWQLDIALLALLCGMSLTTWVAAIGANAVSEVRAAALALVIIVSLWASFAVAVALVGDDTPGPFAPDAAQVVAAGLPGGLFISEPLSGKLLHAAGSTLVFLTVHALLLRRWLAVYGAQSAPSRETARKSSVHVGVLAPPMASPWRAIVWQTLRTCLPVIAGSLVLAAASTAFIYASVSARHGATVREGFEIGSTMTIGCGFLAALIVGVGVLLEDLRPGLHRFWRSRPISPDAWYWTKFATGAISLAVPFGIAAALWFSLPALEALSKDFESVGVASFALLYASVVAAHVAVRQPVYSAILGVTAYGFLAVAWLSSESPLHPFAAPGLFVTTALVALAGWQAFRRDWSLARR